MAPRPDWNLRMVRSREARELLPKLPGAPEQVDWRDLRVGHLDTGFTEHPVFGDWATGAVWLRTADGLNLREGGSDAHDPLDYEGSPGHGTRTCSIVCGDAQPLPGEAAAGERDRRRAAPAGRALSDRQPGGADAGAQSRGRGGTHRDMPSPRDAR